jgi:hypothetical protein
MPSNPTRNPKATLIVGLFYRQGWHYYIGPKITPSSTDAFPTKEEAAAHLQQEIDGLIARFSSQ